MTNRLAIMIAGMLCFTAGQAFSGICGKTDYEKMEKLYNQAAPFTSQEALSGYWTGWSVNECYPGNSDANLALAGKQLNINGVDKFFAVIMGMRSLCGADIDPAAMSADELKPVLDKGLLKSALDGCETVVGSGDSYTYCKNMAPPTKETFRKVVYERGKVCLISRVENNLSVSYAFLCRLQPQ